MYLEKRSEGVPGITTGKQIKYKSYTLRNYKNIPQIKDNFDEEQLFEMDVVGKVLPFKANNYVVDKLIDWNNVPEDPIFVLTFPQKNMLKKEQFDRMAAIMKDSSASVAEVNAVANEIRMDLNPHPAGQLDYNVPVHKGQKLIGMQHKYRETVLFFPKQSQTCHAYCTFCFRWPQFIGLDDLKFSMKDIQLTIDYIKDHPEVSDILFTGGDPMVMSGKLIAGYINALLDANIPHLKNIRIGTKALAYWPYKFTTDNDADLVIRTFDKIRKAGKHLAIMAHFNHHNELRTEELAKAVRRIIDTGAQIRTQSPILRYINADADVWAKMWRSQVRLRMVPYYMFMSRDTGAKHYFNVPLEEAWNIFRRAYQKVSGLGRTVRGPVMSCGPGKVQMLGVNKIHGEKIMTLRFIQGRNSKWVHKPFFAKYDKEASWIDDLEPAFGEEKFFFEDELHEIYSQKNIESISED